MEKNDKKWCNSIQLFRLLGVMFQGLKLTNSKSKRAANDHKTNKLQLL